MFNPTYRLQNLSVQNLTTVNDLVILGSVNLPLSTGANVGSIVIQYQNDGVSSTPVPSSVTVSPNISTGTISLAPGSLSIQGLGANFTWPSSIQVFGAGFNPTAVSGNPQLNYWNAVQGLNLSNLRISYWPPSSPQYPNSLFITNLSLANLGVENADLNTFATPGQEVVTAVINFIF